MNISSVHVLSVLVLEVLCEKQDDGQVPCRVGMKRVTFDESDLEPSDDDWDAEDEDSHEEGWMLRIQPFEIIKRPTRKRTYRLTGPCNITESSPYWADEDDEDNEDDQDFVLED